MCLQSFIVFLSRLSQSQISKSVFLYKFLKMFYTIISTSMYREVPKLSTLPFGGEYLTLRHFHGGSRAKLYPKGGT